MRASAVIALLAVVSGPLAAEAAEAPRFEDFKAAKLFSGRAVRVNLKSAPDARRFRTVLREGAAQGPNFAGHFTVVTWGCGTECKAIAVVDASSGSVVFAPFLSELGQDFRLDSRLLIVNPKAEVQRFLGGTDGCDGAYPPNWLTTRYYEWNGTEFRLVAEVPACAPAK